jgi:hypothetical protein
MGEPRKHHYVPVFHQRRFANSSGLLWVYDRRLKFYKELHPRLICFEKDLYAMKPEGKPRDRRIETMLMSQVDSMGSHAMQQLTSRNATQDTIETVAYYIGVQFNRLPSSAKVVGDIWVRSAEEYMRLLSVDVGRMKSSLERFQRQTGKSVNVSPEEMIEMVRDGDVRFSATEVPFLRAIFSHAQSLMKALVQLEWQVLEAPPNAGFIICDAPVTVVPPRHSTQVGFCVPGAVKYFPLSRHHCLRLGDDGFSLRYRSVSKETVQIVNYNIAANSERVIMGTEKPQLTSVVKRSGSMDEDTSPRFTVEAVDVTDEGSLQKLTFQPRRYFYGKGDSAP